ncbi:hypothetical protein COU57_01145 [Candidatus Pacearchaeota archaeon CG10_big_fil_rev_8_21_14_0_10_32_14]|nr:MAG: hypothetical protein COU57_01145 [Candidatus Pacearchaeota archaeon CG10_big_fil_rev_8_21_14_0_10_32_14]
MRIDDKVKEDKPKEEEWVRLYNYSEDFGMENDVVRVEVRDGKTIRTIAEYRIRVYGAVYKKGNEEKHVEERRDRRLVRQYDSESFAGTLRQ